MNERWIDRIEAPLLLAVLVALLAGTPTQSAAQTFDLGGFIKMSYYYDSRQVAAAREGDFILYPLPENEVDGEDLNATDNLLFFPFFSRLSLGIGDLPQVGEATVSGHLETDFFGANNTLLNSMRIRRAFVKLDWETHEALFGMDWSPTFVEMSPRTVATEAGAPYQPFARYPQARFTLKPGKFRLMALAAQQRDAFGEISGLKPQQQAGVPTLMGFVEYIDEDFKIGAGAWNKWIRPELGGERFDAIALQGFFEANLGVLSVRGKATWGEDLADQLMTGGYYLLDTGEALPLRTFAGWGDVEYKAGNLGYGVFGGYFTNLGTGESVADPTAGEFFARGQNIDHGYRVAPRVVYDAGKVRFAFELPIDTAMYASGLDEELAPETGDDDESVTNVRADFSVFLFF